MKKIFFILLLLLGLSAPAFAQRVNSTEIQFRQRSDNPTCRAGYAVIFFDDVSNTLKKCENGGAVSALGGAGTVTSVSVVTANGVSGSVATATTTPAITLTLGAITPTTVNKVTLTTPATGSTLTIVDGATLTASATATVSGTNTGDQTITLTGDVTGTGTGSFAATIAASSVTLAKMANIATASLIGRTTAATGVPEALTVTQATAMLNVFGADAGAGGVKGLVPATIAGDSTKFLKGDGTWAASGGTPGGSTTQLQRNNAGAFGGISGATSDGTAVTFGSANLIATRPRVITSLDDTNGNEIFGVTATTSAVNELNLANAATGGNPVISATGGDANIGLTLTPKGSGEVVLTSPNLSLGGTTSGFAAFRGRVGFPYQMQLTLADNSTRTQLWASQVNIDAGADSYVAKAYMGAATSDIGVGFAATAFIGWANGTDAQQAKDTGISRISSGLIGIGTGATGSFAGGLKLSGITFTNLADSSTAPTLSGFGTSPSVAANNGTVAFTINVGTGGTASTGTITLPAATTGWVCNIYDVTNPASFVTDQSGGTTTTVTVTNYSRTTGLAIAWTASDILRCSCRAY